MTELDILGQTVIDNCKELNITLQPLQVPEIAGMARNMGYEPLEYGTIYEDQTQGLLVQLPEDRNTYNNGIYMLHLAKSEDGTSNQYLLEVIVPNTKSRDTLIHKTIGDITTYVESLNTSDLDVYDFAEVYGFVIANTVIKHLAKTLYPDTKDKQVLYTNLYMSRFLAHVAHVYAGSDKLKEETVNSDPYLFKMLVDGLKKEDLEKLSTLEAPNVD